MRCSIGEDQTPKKNSRQGRSADTGKGAIDRLKMVLDMPGWDLSMISSPRCHVLIGWSRQKTWLPMAEEGRPATPATCAARGKQMPGMPGSGMPHRQATRSAAETQAAVNGKQQALAGETFEGSAGGGMVTAVVTGTGEVVSVKIDPSVLDPDDPELVGDLVVAAINQALAAMREEAADFGHRVARRTRSRRPEPRRPGRTARVMFEAPIQRLIDELARLPGIGRKSAQRLAFHLLKVEEEDARRLAVDTVDAGRGPPVRPGVQR